MSSDPLIENFNLYDVILTKDEYVGVSNTEKRHRALMGRKKSSFARLEKSASFGTVEGRLGGAGGERKAARRRTHIWTNGGNLSGASFGSKDKRRFSLLQLRPNGVKSESSQKPSLKKTRKKSLAPIVEEKKDEPTSIETVLTGLQSPPPNITTTVGAHPPMKTVPEHHRGLNTVTDTQKKAKGLAPSLSRTLLATVYTRLLPQLTWVLLLAAIFLPSRLRPIVLLLQILPIIVMSFTRGCGTRGRALFKQIALSRSMDVTFQQARTPEVTDSEHSGSSSSSFSSSSESSDCESNSDESYLFGFHPHGKCPLEVFPLLASAPETFGNMYLAQSSLGKAVPTVGYTTALFGNVIDATKAAITSTVEAGGDVGIFPGGVKEMILCVPGSDEIPIVRHAGFLRLAASLGRPIRPSFIFGMNDAYENPFPKIDSAVYKMTGAAIPWWSCSNKKGGDDERDGPRMVVGKRLRCYEGETEAEFTDRYYAALDYLFESHKNTIGKDRYKIKRLVFVDPHKRDGRIKQTSQPGPTATSKRLGRARAALARTPHVIATKFALGFVLIFFVDRAWTGAYRKFSTWGTYGASDHNAALFLHIISSTGWALTSAFLTLKRFNKYHRRVGAFGVTFAILMAISGALITLKGAEKSNLNFNSAFHALCNLQISYVTIYMAVYGVLCAAHSKFRDLVAHKQTFRTLHVLIGVNFMPRVVAMLVSQIAGSRKGSTLRVRIIRCNQVALAAAFGALVLNSGLGVVGKEGAVLELGVGVGFMVVEDLRVKVLKEKKD
ncbi:hypothetical protein TrLO_g1644 [Triparma laevis f. longispina]|uniref:diacylglycerol O-acyltransferase n=1 Tax=Triparma laevis f. longispina TaxID=1714387 RepID=A0A9W7E989_9STRA|nr:hypothetical protein TrLO_g1644 [Triparma laevis f. longispina]